MWKIRQAIVVEGRYDKSAIARYLDTVIIETGGFRIFTDPEKLALLRRLAERQGLIILTDSDASGFLIRNRLKSMLPPEALKQAYIPDIYGKERRKAAPSGEGKLGVEAMDEQTILLALRRAGATFEDAICGATEGAVTKADMYEDGLCGMPRSGGRRRAMLKKLSLPEHMSSSALLEVINTLYSRKEYKELVKTLIYDKI